jgi:hypothetical protein
MNEQNLIILPQDKFESLVERSVQQALKKALPDVIKRASLPKFLSTKQLSRLASWSQGKIHYMRQEGRIKYIQEGRSIVYPTEWILDYLEAHSISPNQEVLKELEKSDSRHFSKE